MNAGLLHDRRIVYAVDHWTTGLLGTFELKLQTGIGLHEVANSHQNINSDFSIPIWIELTLMLINEAWSQYGHSASSTTSLYSVAKHMRAVSLVIVEGTLIFLRGLCGYVWVSIITSSHVGACGPVDKALDSRSEGLEFDYQCWPCVEVSCKLCIPHHLGPPSRNGYLVHRYKVRSIVAGCTGTHLARGKVKSVEHALSWSLDSKQLPLPLPLHRLSHQCKELYMYVTNCIELEGGC